MSSADYVESGEDAGLIYEDTGDDEEKQNFGDDYDQFDPEQPQSPMESDYMAGGRSEFFADESEKREPVIVKHETSIYKSKEMKKLLALNDPEERIPTGLNDVTYDPTKVFPEWVLSNPVWRNVATTADTDDEISKILKKHKNERTQDETSILIKFLMSVWKFAEKMGFKKCGQMIQQFKYREYIEGQNVIVEGDRGKTFYIIVSGSTNVHKDGIGIVGQMSKGKTFGELALRDEVDKDLRTATVTASSAVLELLELHKDDYDYYVKDLQDAERRENFHLLSQCKLFKSWPKNKIDSMCDCVSRTEYEPGQNIFKQGDEPENLYVVMEGCVNIIKELIVVSTNRWPTSMDSWAERTKKVHKPTLLGTLSKGDFFGEVAIIRNQPRGTTCTATVRTVLITLNKDDFKELIGHGKLGAFQTSEGNETINYETINKYIGDQDIIRLARPIKGGPHSEVRSGDLTLSKQEVDKKFLVKPTEFSKPIPAAYRTHKHKKHGLSNQKSIDSLGSIGGNVARITKGEDMVEQLKNIAGKTLTTERMIQDRVDAMGGGFVPRKSIIGRDSVASPSHSQQRATGFFRNRLETARRSSIGFSKLPPSNKRNSLIGIDNENPDQIAASFNNKVMMRKNSSVRMGELYDQFYRKLQMQSQQHMNPEGQVVNGNAHRRGTRSASIFNNIKNNVSASDNQIQRNSMYSNSPHNANSHNSNGYNAYTPNNGSNAGHQLPSFRRQSSDDGGDSSGEESSQGQGMTQQRRPFTTANDSAFDLKVNTKMNGYSDGISPLASPANKNNYSNDRADITNLTPKHFQMRSTSANNHSSNNQNNIYNNPNNGSYQNNNHIDNNQNGNDNTKARRRSQRKTIADMKLLNKPIISYRDAMDG